MRAHGRRSLRDMEARVALVALAAAVAAACSPEGATMGGLLSGQSIDQVTRSGSGYTPAVLPDPSDTVIRGWAKSLAGGTMSFFGNGQILSDAEATVTPEGSFQRAFPGTAEYRGFVMWGTLGDRVVAGVLPELPRQPTVFHEEHVIDIFTPPYGHASLADVNDATTVVAMVISARARQSGFGLAALERTTIAATLDDVVAELGDDGSPVLTFAKMVKTLDLAAGATTSGQGVFVRDGFTGAGSFLNRAWLLGHDVDYDGDAQHMADKSTAPFDAALEAAAASIDLALCYQPGVMPVVFHVDLREGTLNRNCAAVDAYKWSSKQSGKTAFFTGGVHPDCPICGPDRTTGCLTEDQVDEVNQLLGNWVPNQVPMFDDGTHGDANAGDGVWTVSFVLPYIETATSTGGAGVRLGYKYTYGLPGQGWTDSEEWPGNQRLFEVEDLSGDHIATRYDIFGDEAANKDKVNALKPSKGGCGTIAWEAGRDPECAGDSRENMIDTDGDCSPDAWDDPAPIVPLTVSCDS